MSTYDTSLRYETFCTRYDTYRVSYDTDNYDYNHGLQLIVTNWQSKITNYGHRSVMPLERNHSGNPDTVIEKNPNYGIG